MSKVIDLGTVLWIGAILTELWEDELSERDWEGFVPREVAEATFNRIAYVLTVESLEGGATHE